MSHVSRSSARLHQLLMSGSLLLAPAVVACGASKTIDDGNSTLSATGGQGVSPTGPGGAGGTSGLMAVANGAGAPPGVAAAAGAGIGTGPVAAGAGGRGETAQALHDHCVYGYDPQPTDANMKDGPAEYYPAGKTDKSIVDLTVQPEVLSWMQSHFWEAAHVEWHAIRTCNLPGGPRGSKVNICQFTDMIPTDQNCQSTGDGYQFLLFHRHMLEALKQLWPKHSEQFSAFERFPQSADDVPAQWRAAWQKFNTTDLANAKIAEEIDKPENLALFPDEGALGFWLQCNVGTTIKGFSLKSGGLHGDLHAHWVRQGNTDHGLGNTSSNIDNYMFWKLHGWMDNVWEKYRMAKGLKRTDAKYVDDMRAQCLRDGHRGRVLQDRRQTRAGGRAAAGRVWLLPRESAADLRVGGQQVQRLPFSGRTRSGHVARRAHQFEGHRGWPRQSAGHRRRSIQAHRAGSAGSELALFEDHGDDEQLHGHECQPVLHRYHASLRGWQNDRERGGRGHRPAVDPGRRQGSRVAPRRRCGSRYLSARLASRSAFLRRSPAWSCL